MKHTLHLVSGLCGGATLTRFLQEAELSEEVLAFEDALSVAPLPSELSLAALDERIDALVRLYYVEEEYIALIRNGWERLLSKDYTSYDKIVVWSGKSSKEQLFLYLVATLLDQPLYQVDISALSTLREIRILPSQLSSGSLSEKDIAMLYPTVALISPRLHAHYRTLWHKWSISSSTLRLNDAEGDVFAADETYFDDLILSVCTDEFSEPSRVIGNVFGRSDQLVGDSFLRYRMVAMIRQAKLIASNNENYRKRYDELVAMNILHRIAHEGVDLSWLGGFSVKLAPKQRQ